MAEINIPTSWAGVTLQQLSDLNDIRANQSLNDIHQTNRIIAVLAGVPLSIIEAIPWHEVVKINDQLGWTLEMPTKIIPEFTIQGVTYCLTRDIYRGASGQFADLKHFISQDTGGFYRWAQCAAVMCLPKGEDYDSKKVEARAELFWQHLPVDVIHPYTGFFLLLFERSLPIMQNSLIRIMKQTKEMVNETLTELAQDS